MRNPRGFVGVLIVVALAVLLAWAAFWREPWLPHVPAPHATSTAPIAEQYELTAADNGKIFIYPATSRFGVVLDGRYYPRPDCVPAGIVGSISNIPAVPAPLVASRFEAVVPGSCTLVAGSWSVIIVVTG